MWVWRTHSCVPRSHWCESQWTQPAHRGKSSTIGATIKIRNKTIPPSVAKDPECRSSPPIPNIPSASAGAVKSFALSATCGAATEPSARHTRWSCLEKTGGNGRTSNPITRRSRLPRSQIPKNNSFASSAVSDGTPQIPRIAGKSREFAPTAHVPRPPGDYARQIRNNGATLLRLDLLPAGRVRPIRKPTLPLLAKNAL